MPDRAIDCRQISVDDWPLWRTLRLHALEEDPYAFGSQLADWQGEGDTEERWRHRLSSVPINIVASIDQQAAGIVSATAPDQNATVELISMWVAPFARGCGIGDSLVCAILHWARGQAAARVALGVFEKNQYATGLYIRHGFVDGGAIDSPDSRGQSERRMVRELTESAGPRGASL